MTKKVLRMNIVGGMNEYILNYINDEYLIERWQAFGVPDEATEEDLEWFADDDREFADLTRLFAQICRADIEED